MDQDNVVPFRAGKLQRTAPANSVACSCGSRWWELAITITIEHRVGGYALPMTCRECGTPAPFELVLLP